MAGSEAEHPVTVHKRPAPGVDSQCPPELPPAKRAAAHLANGASPIEAPPTERACILRPPHSDSVFEELAARLRRGLLVSFPTETVYGLGANGLDAKAVLGIFEAKGRPLSDPCILHVSRAEEAEQLLDLDATERAVFDALTVACWPGPLSIVGKAKPVVPPEVTASTGFVAVRCPDHALARQLIAAAGVPLAAPSANRFGHISPTLPEHVLEDLGHVDTLRILDGGACGVGIESTVLRLDLARGRVVVLRKGGVTKERLEAVLASATLSAKGDAPLHGRAVAVEYSERLSASAEGMKQQEAACPDEAQQAPGMLLRHYSPAVPSALLSPEAATEADAEGLPHEVGQSVLIDFARGLQWAHCHFLRVFDLCSEERESREGGGSVEEACSRAFAVLRAAEAFALEQGGCFICIADFDAARLGSFAEALHDRMFRAASGRRVALRLPVATAANAGGRPGLVELRGRAP